MTGGSTGTGAFSGTGQSRGSSWSDFARGAAQPAEAVDTGSVLKERFVLEEVIGRGGMGIVFKSRDTLQEEMQDRNPYVAIKVLNEDFKKHPESLKALQREARKAQNLAHPNIATVFNFDRDGGNVFVVMELLDGESLDKLIKRSDGGIPVNEALRITEGLGRALAYAHDKGVIHSDFKPANAFLTKDGAVKVFDFGIARAARRGTHVAGTETLFDAGTLGALTPAYASCEMIEGGEPDPRDDVYALACVAYELLTGTHPFGKQSAVKARDAKLVPKPVKGLSRRQWQGLRRGLAFEREQRTPSVEQFLQDIRPLKLPIKTMIAGGVGAVVLLALLGVFLKDMLADRSDKALRTVLESGDYDAVSAGITKLAQLDDLDRRNLILTDAAREHLVAVYAERARQAFDPGEGRFDYSEASRLLAELRDYAGKTQSFARMERALEDNKGEAERRIGESVDLYLKDGLLIDQQSPRNLVVALGELRMLNPQSDRLRNPDQVRGYQAAFAQSARRALDTGDLTLAGKLIEAEKKLAAQLGVASSGDLGTVAAQIADRGREAEQARRAAQLRESVRQLGGAPALEQLAQRRADIEELMTLVPEQEATAVRRLVDQALAGRLDQLEKSGDFDSAQALLDEYARLATPEYTAQRQKRLASTLENRQLIEQKVAAIEENLRSLVGRPDLASERWERDLQNELAALESYRPAGGDAFAGEIRATVAGRFVDGARELRAQGRLSEARRYLDKAAKYVPALPQIGVEQRAIQLAEQQQQQNQQRQQQEAQIARLKSGIREQAQAHSFDRALNSISELRTLLPADDPFLVQDVPVILAGAYATRAEKLAIEGKFRLAIAQVDDGLKQLGGMGASQQARQTLEKPRKTYERLDRIQQRLGASGRLDVPAIRADLDQLRREKHRAFRDWERALLAGMEKRVQQAYRQGEAQGSELLGQAKQIFTDKDDGRRLEALRVVAAAPTPKPSAPTGNAPTTEPRDAVAATQPKPIAEPGTGGVVTASPPEAAPSAATTPGAVAGAGGQGPSVEQASKPSAAGAAPVPAAAVPSGAAGQGPSVAQDRCALRIAGMGGKRGGSCSDPVLDGEGPLLVVVPSGGPGPFAISKYEISEADYARYCSDTRKCQATSSSNPQTSVSASDAESYANWLSEKTGRRYRLPTDAEWQYAARAGGSTGAVDYNCRSTSGGTGEKLLSTRVGTPNGWGLVNVGGNAQELTRAGGGWTARGGAFKDPINECGPEASRVHLGRPDPETGFRVVRELQK